MQPFDAVPRLLQAAVQHHLAGRLGEAEKLYRQVLQIDRAQPDALHLLGVCANQQGRHAEAVDLIRRAIERHPRAADYHVNLGNALQEAGDRTEAAASFRRAIQLDPRSVEASTNLGNLGRLEGDLESARRHYQQALAIRPGHLKALLGLGQTLQQLGCPAEAAPLLAQAATLDPDNEAALVSLADSFDALGRTREAAEASGRLLARFPGNSAYQGKHLELLSKAGLHEAALELAQSLVEADPSNALAHDRLGLVLAAVARFSEALAAFRRARELDPRLASAASNEALNLWNQGRAQEAMAAARAAAALSAPDSAAASGCLLYGNYLEELTPAELFEEHRRWGRRQAVPAPAASLPRAGSRLRVGYVSADFRMHSVSFFMEPILEFHDRSKFEVHCYYNGRAADAKTARLKTLAGHWHDIVDLDDARLLEAIRRDGMDILVDLSGHTGNNRLSVFARRAAPVQITYLGYPNTTGLPAMDYRVTDAIADPPGESDRLHVERLLRLPDGFLCYRPEPGGPEVGPPPSLAMGHITFGSFNALPKLSPGTIELWAEIMGRVPDSRLLLKARGLADPDPRDRLGAAFERLGIASHRIVFLPAETSHTAHLDLYGRVDIALDPFPYNGTTTTCETLWMGVPVVTLNGDRHAARVGASLLHRIGLDDLVAQTREDYVAKAVALAGDAQRLSRLRQSIRPMMQASPLMDGAAFTRQLEAAYLAVHERRE